MSTLNMTTKSYWMWDKVLSDEFCNNVINEGNKEIEEKGIKGTVGSNKVKEEIRKTDIAWISEMSPIGCLLQVYINAANHYANWGYGLTNMEEIQFSKYTDKNKSFYDWHFDTGIPDSQNKQRKLSAIALLSEPKDFEGGHLELKNNVDNKILLPKKGSVIVFPSFQEHRVTEITKGTRYSAVSWMKGEAFR